MVVVKNLGKAKMLKFVYLVSQNSTIENNKNLVKIVLNKLS